jgi:hypothetical protein
MGTKHTVEFRQEAVRVALTSGLTRKQVGPVAELCRSFNRILCAKGE